MRVCVQCSPFLSSVLQYSCFCFSYLDFYIVSKCIGWACFYYMVVATLKAISLFILLFFVMSEHLHYVQFIHVCCSVLEVNAFSLWSYKLSMLLKENGGLWSIVSSANPKPIPPQDVGKNGGLRSEKPMQLSYWILKNSIVAQVKGAKGSIYDNWKTLYDTKSMTTKLAL